MCRLVPWSFTCFRTKKPGMGRFPSWKLRMLIVAISGTASRRPMQQPCRHLKFPQQYSRFPERFGAETVVLPVGGRRGQLGTSTAMAKEDEFRKNAAKTITLAQRASSIADKGRLLALAEAWLDLIERHRESTRR